jgi:hypothetical protein
MGGHGIEAYASYPRAGFERTQRRYPAVFSPFMFAIERAATKVAIM